MQINPLSARIFTAVGLLVIREQNATQESMGPDAPGLDLSSLAVKGLIHNWF